MSVRFRCKICGREHPVPAGFNSKEAFESGSVKAKNYPCPSTGRSASYVKNDMRWIDRI
jgi:hypothetical protein